MVATGYIKGHGHLKLLVGNSHSLMSILTKKKFDPMYRGDVRLTKVPKNGQKRLKMAKSATSKVEKPLSYVNKPKIFL